MSTMYEALRKAEAERRQAGGQANNGLAQNDPGPAGAMTDNAKIIVLVIAVIGVFGIAFVRINGARSVSAVKKPAVAQVAVKAVQAPAPVAVKPVRAPGTYGVDGIIDAGPASMAVINGRLLKVDEKIDHLVVKVITAHEVELLNTKDNTTMTLKF